MSKCHIIIQFWFCVSNNKMFFLNIYFSLIRNIQFLTVECFNEIMDFRNFVNFNIKKLNRGQDQLCSFTALYKSKYQISITTAMCM